MADQAKLTSRDIQGMIAYELEQSKSVAWPFQCGLEAGSDQEKETYVILGASPAMREWLGNRSRKSLKTASVDVINKKFEATILVAVDDMRRDKTNFIQMRISELVTRANSHWAKLLTTLRLAGTSTVCVDGKYFYAANHSWGSSGTYSNLLTSSDYSALAVTDRGNVTPDEMAKAILKVISHFFTINDDQGEPANEDANLFMVHVPVAMMAAATEACASKFLSTGSGVRDNVLTNQDVQQNLFKVIPQVNPRLTSGYDFYVDRIDSRAKPFILQSETGIQQSKKAEGSDFEHDTDMHEYGIKTNRNVGFALPYMSIKATVSNAG